MLARKNADFRTQAVLTQTAIMSAFGGEGTKAFKAALKTLDVYDED